MASINMRVFIPQSKRPFDVLLRPIIVANKIAPLQT